MIPKMIEETHFNEGKRNNNIKKAANKKDNIIQVYQDDGYKDNQVLI